LSALQVCNLIISSDAGSQFSILTVLSGQQSTLHWFSFFAVCGSCCTCNNLTILYSRDRPFKKTRATSWKISSASALLPRHRCGAKGGQLTCNVVQEGNPQESPSNLRLHLLRRSGPLNPAATRATASLELPFHPSTYYSTSRTLKFANPTREVAFSIA
jgi:hypothetical protein